MLSGQGTCMPCAKLQWLCWQVIVARLAFESCARTLGVAFCLTVGRGCLEPPPEGRSVMLAEELKGCEASAGSVFDALIALHLGEHDMP